MSYYGSDFKKDYNFSEKVHQVAKSIIYKENILLEKASVKEDNENGIDYFVNVNGDIVSIQERFRIKNNITKDSLEFTLRYKRPNSLSDNQKKSEYFKIKADFLVYGIINNENKDDNIDSITFLRYVVINLKELRRAIRDNKIYIDENLKSEKPYSDNQKIYAIVKENKEEKDGNSQFLIFDTQHLKLLKDEYRIIIREFNYLKKRKILSSQINYK